MANKEAFLVSVATARAYIGDDCVFTGNALVSSGITAGLQSTEIRGGIGNQLQGLYYHTSSFSVNITDTHWDLKMLGLNFGTDVSVGGNILSSESVTIAGNTGTLTKTPVAMGTSTQPYVWASYNGDKIKCPATDNTFSTVGTTIPDGAIVCAEYLTTDGAAQKIIVPANYVPSRVRLILTASLFGTLEGQGSIGTVTIEIPSFQLTGSQDLSLTADGYSQLQFSGNALAYSDSSAGCTAGAYYAIITQSLTGGQWYDNVIALAISGDDFSIAQTETKDLLVYAVKNDGTSFLCNNENLKFVSSTPANATVSSKDAGDVAPYGRVTGVLAGTSEITVSIVGAPDISAKVTATVTA